MTKRLNTRQERFCDLVSVGMSRPDAYVEAYGKPEDYTRDLAIKSASRLCQDPHVMARINELRNKITEAAMADPIRLLRETMAIATADPRKLYAPNGRALAPHELDDSTAAAVRSVQSDERGRFSYDFWDKNVAHEKLAKYLGLYEKDNRQKTDPMKELAKALLGSVVGPGGVDISEPD